MIAKKTKLPVVSKPRRPRLTRNMVNALSALAGYAEASAEMMGDTAFERRHRREIEDGVDFIWQLCRWYNQTHS